MDSQIKQFREVILLMWCLTGFGAMGLICLVSINLWLQRISESPHQPPQIIRPQVFALPPASAPRSVHPAVLPSADMPEKDLDALMSEIKHSGRKL